MYQVMGNMYQDVLIASKMMIMTQKYSIDHTNTENVEEW